MIKFTEKVFTSLLLNALHKTLNLGSSGTPRQQEHHTLSYNNEKRFPRVFLFADFASILVLSSIQNDLFCSCFDDENTCRKMFNCFSQFPNRSHEFNSRIVDTHFASQRAWINRVAVELLMVKTKVMHARVPTALALDRG